MTITDEQVALMVDIFYREVFLSMDKYLNTSHTDKVKAMRAALASVQREGVKMPGTVVYMETHGGHAQEPLIIRSEMIAALKAAGAEIVE